MLAPSSSSFFSLPTRANVMAFLLFSFLAAGCANFAPNKVPSLSLSATSFSFATVTVGQSSTEVLTISNTGTSPLDITAVSLSSNEFTITGPSVPRVILPANSVSYTLLFAPTSSGTVSSTVRITTNASRAPATVSLTGSGQKAFANLLISPSSVNFGKLAVKSTLTQSVTLQNTGDINLAIQGVTVAGSGFGYSDLSPGLSLAPNQKVTFQVWFTPKVAGPASATLSLLSPNTASAGTLGLSGEGEAPTTAAPNTPAAPTPHAVELSWNASASTVIGYRVYRSEAAGGSFSLLTGSAVTALTYKDTTVSDGTTYYYVVTAVDVTGAESVYSNQASASIPSS